MPKSKPSLFIAAISFCCGLYAWPALSQDDETHENFTRIALNKPLPSSLLGLDCSPVDLTDVGIVVAIACLPDNLFDAPAAAVTVEPVSELGVEDLREKTREAFSSHDLNEIILEDSFDIKDTPSAIGLRGIYNTSGGLRRTWAVYHDGVFIRAVVVILSQKADGKYEDEILATIFRPERFQPLPEAVSESSTTDE